MKAHFTRFDLTMRLLLWLCFFLPVAVTAQPDYTFKNSVLIGGTDLQVGAKYRFSDVKPGYDCIVTITDMTGGMTLDLLDGPSGFDEAFQPYINCAPKQEGYVEFQFDFVQGGTFTPAVMAEVPMTAIDIDGYKFPDNFLYELDQFEINGSFTEQYDMLATSLSINHSGGWAEPKNISGITYNGIDTVQRDVMYSAVYSNISSVKYRCGADDKSTNGMLRLRSVYFKKFYFNNGLLSLNGLERFTGTAKNNAVDLAWTLADGNSFTDITIERSINGKGFLAVEKMNVPYPGTSQNMGFSDPFTSSDKMYYRLRLTEAGGKVQYSNVLMFSPKPNAGTGFKVFPSLVSSGATISTYSAVRGQARVFISDYSGRIVMQKMMSLNTGSNSIALDGIDRLARGNYVVVMDMDGQRMAQSIVKQ